ncbi:MAG TPA: hypothetical protein VGX25_16030 [Actinophytocola sp.]|uniref:hypothetical protein n=1 Tax=Actinophytocola sp. TaxID=1872138 RepID=UPI002DDCF14E|nr:hypothetical protein [Actinophytocola sp.]HEV2780894.1 hypothetical protein [Actinophytocola sp.]
MRWVLPMVLLALLAAAVGGLVARQVYASPEPAPPAAAVPSAGTVPPSDQPGSPTVMPTEEAAAHPRYETVRGLLQTYFDAINARDYARWRTVVSDRRAGNQPELKWRTDYRSTKDGSIAIWRIETGPADGRVLISFTSVQDVADAPLELPEPCIHWRVVIPLTMEDGAWKLDSGPSSSAPQHEKC